MKILHNFQLIALTAFASVIVMRSAFAQGWVKQASGTTNNLNSVYFVNTDTGFAAGDAGTLLRTTNGGNDWTSLSSGTTNSLYEVKFFDPGNGVIVGDAGIVLKTTDGGISWSSESSGTTANLTAVSFADSTTLVAGAENGTIIRSTDGGITWTGVANPSGHPAAFTSISFGNANDGLACAPTAYTDILRTTDAGTTWSVVNESFTLYGVQYISSNTAIAVGYEIGTGSASVSAKTTDNGRTWNGTGGPFDRYAELTAISAPEANFWSVIDDKNNADQILCTTNGGSSWNAQITGNFYAIFFTDSNNGTVVGSGGTIMHTTDGGATIPPEPALDLPLNGTTGVSTSVMLEFHPATLFASYGLQVSKDSNFTTFVLNLSNLHPANDGNIYYLLSGLDSNTVYYWRANTSNVYGTSSWSKTWHFKTISSYPNLVVYDGTLQSPWDDASWSSTVVYTDTNAIKVSADAWGSWSAHYGSWGSQVVNPATYSGLGVSLYGNASVGIEFENDSSQSFPYILENAGGNNWMDYKIPMSSLNPNDYSITRIDVQSNNSAPVEYFVKNIRLIGGPKTTSAANSLTYAAKGLKMNNYMPLTFNLLQNYPNPFNPSTVIRYQLASKDFVTLKIYDELGRVVQTLVNQYQNQGWYRVNFNASNLASGLYIYRIQAGRFIAAKKMMLLK